MRRNLVLIGMPGAGKSTVGVILAKLSSRAFVDTDLLIQSAQGRTLQAIVDSDGHAALRRIEEEILLGLVVQNHVIATGGSGVYSEEGMRHLKAQGLLIFLDVDLPTLVARVGDFRERGIAKAPGQSFAELFAERRALYQRHAEITIACAGLTMEAICEKILAAAGKEN